MVKIFNLNENSHRTNILLLVVISFFMLMFGNNILSLTHPDEVFYIQSAKEMVNNNSWLTPLIFDHVQFEKPILSYFLFAVVIKFFGLSPFVARFWPACFGMIGVLVIYWISFMLFKKKVQAFLSSVILSTSFIYIALSRAVLTDMIFSVFVAISIGFFYLATTGKEDRDFGIIWGFIFSGISILTKGLLGFCFPFATILIYVLLTKNLKVFKTKATLIGIFLMFLISVPWHLLMYFEHGKWFLEEYFGNVHFRRLLVAEHPKLDNWYFYLALMFAGVMPWSLFWVPSIVVIKETIIRNKEHKKQILFLLSWIIAIYVFVQPAHSKLASYIFPVFPAIAVILSYSIYSIINGQNVNNLMRKLFLIVPYIMSLILIVGSCVGWFFATKYLHIIGGLLPVYVGIFLLIILGLTMFFLNLYKKYDKIVFTFVGISIGLLIFLFFGRPYAEPWVSCIEVSQKLNQIDKSKSVVLASKFYVRGVRFYTDRKMAVIDINGDGFFSPHPIPFLNSDKKVLNFLSSQKTTFAVVKEGNVEDLKRILADNEKFKIIEHFGRGGKFILEIVRL